MENKKRNSVATVILTIVCVLWMYPIVLIFINSLKKEVSDHYFWSVQPSYR